MMKKDTSLEILKKRYPDIGFFLSFFPYEPIELPEDSTSLEAWLEKQDLREIDILYIVGLIGYSLPKSISDWLEEKKERALIFIEEELGAFASFKNTNLLDNPQIHLYYAQEDPIEVLAQMFPCDHLAIFEGKPFDVLTLQRRSAALSALYSDVLYSHKIVENVFKNFSYLASSFDTKGDCKNIPAIICGAGPSLEKSLPELREMKDKALIFAGGSAITALTQNQVAPHFAMALDPNREEFERLKQSTFFEGPFLFAPRLNRQVFSTVNGPFGYMKTDTGGLAESWLEEKLGIEGEPVGAELGSEAFSVTTMAISYAQVLGCNPIILVGVDLSYKEGKRYPDGIEAEEAILNDPRALEKPLVRKGIHGEEVETLLKWVMEADCISAFAENHPDTQILNATEGGLGFEGIPNTSLSQALKGAQTQDLSGAIHQWVVTTPFSFDDEKFTSLMDQLCASLDRCEHLCRQILKELEKGPEGGRLVLYKSDLSEEDAFHCLLEGIDMALERVLTRYHPHIDHAQGKWEREKAKYKELDLQIEKFAKIFGRRCKC